MDARLACYISMSERTVAFRAHKVPERYAQDLFASIHVVPFVVFTDAHGGTEHA